MAVPGVGCAKTADDLGTDTEHTDPSKIHVEIKSLKIYLVHIYCPSRLSVLKICCNYVSLTAGLKNWIALGYKKLLGTKICPQQFRAAQGNPVVNPCSKRQAIYMEIRSQVPNFH